MTDKKKPNYKIAFSLLTICIVILIVILLPKHETPKEYLPPRTSSRVIPAPTPTPKTVSDELQIIEASSQPPSSTLKINSVNIDFPVYIVVEKNGGSIGQSDVITESVENIEIDLTEETKNEDVLLIKAVDELDNVVFQKEVLIINTAVNPGILLPRELQ